MLKSWIDAPGNFFEILVYFLNKIGWLCLFIFAFLENPNFSFELWGGFRSFWIILEWQRPFLYAYNR